MLGVEPSPFQEHICRSVAQDGGGAVSLGAKQITIFCIAQVRPRTRMMCADMVAWL